MAAINVQEGARLPGSRRAEARRMTQRDGVSVDASLLSRIAAMT